MKVNFIDLKKQYQNHKAEIDAAISDIIENCSFIGGQVEEFEQEFAEFCEAKYCIAVNSGTDALKFICQSLNIGPGDEVIVPVNTFIASALAINSAGAQPVFVDIDGEDYNLDVKELEKAINEKTKAIIVVHLYGLPCNMDEIKRLAEKHNLYIIEDACQAHGARYKGTMVGNFGIATAFSFYPGKNLGAYGDGGAVITNNEKIQDKIKKLREYGQRVKYVHDEIGTNSRLDGIQAAILRVKLKHLKDWNKSRREHAEYYNELISKLGIKSQKTFNDRENVYHLFIVEVDKRDELLEYLKDNDIHCGIHYPIPLHLQNAYQELGHRKGSFPVAERVAEKIISLPIYPEIEKEEMEYVVNKIANFLAQNE